MENTDIPKIPTKRPTLCVIPMPADTNAHGDVFGGWLLAQMDLSGATEATRYAKRRVVTVGVNKMNFHEPVFVGDEVSFYTEITRVGRTSITVHIESWARARDSEETRKVTEGTYAFVAIDENRNPTEIENK